MQTAMLPAAMFPTATAVRVRPLFLTWYGKFLEAARK
jgi:hypothetical protein